LIRYNHPERKHLGACIYSSTRRVQEDAMKVIDTSKILVQFVHKGQKSKHPGRPIGYVVAVGNGKIGWSKWDRSVPFDKEFGKNLATGRAINGTILPVPTSMKRAYDRMADRAQKAFAEKKPE
jgi:hypothetical protein